MTLSLRRLARPGILGLIAGCSLIASLPAADARTPDNQFAFSYRTSELDTAAERRALEKRLNTEAARHCRGELGVRRMIGDNQSCRRELVEAVLHAVENLETDSARACLRVEMDRAGPRIETCAPIEYANARLRDVL